MGETIIMKVETIQAAKPDVVITLSWDSAQQLYSMLYEAKSYASDCGESTDMHQEYLTILGRIVDDD